jgi:low affinity Fe/Cu permease
MVFVIQSSQNRDGLALHLKLDELIKAVEGARNGLVAAEELDEAKLHELQDSFRDVAHEAQILQDAERNLERRKLKDSLSKRKVL